MNKLFLLINKDIWYLYVYVYMYILYSMDGGRYFKINY